MLKRVVVVEYQNITDYRRSWWRLKTTAMIFLLQKKKKWDYNWEWGCAALSWSWGSSSGGRRTAKPRKRFRHRRSSSRTLPSNPYLGLKSVPPIEGVRSFVLSQPTKTNFEYPIRNIINLFFFWRMERVNHIIIFFLLITSISIFIYLYLAWLYETGSHQYSSYWLFMIPFACPTCPFHVHSLSPPFPLKESLSLFGQRNIKINMIKKNYLQFSIKLDIIKFSYPILGTRLDKIL